MNARAEAAARAASFLVLLLAALVAAPSGCDDASPRGSGPASAEPPGSEPAGSLSGSPAGPARPPEIIVDHAGVEVGKDRVPAGRGLEDRVAALLRDASSIEGRAVDVVAMRAALPSDVAAVVDALRRSRASAVDVKTEARDSTTASLPLAISARLPGCATVAWIAKDASIDLWPAGGGTARRIVRGLAGPDLTLGVDAMRKQSESCEASQIAVGGDDAMSWGLVFDLATAALHQPWTRASAARLVTGATPGRKLIAP